MYGSTQQRYPRRCRGQAWAGQLSTGGGDGGDARDGGWLRVVPPRPAKSPGVGSNPTGSIPRHNRLSTSYHGGQTMPAKQNAIARRLRYKLPRIKLCLVHEGLKASELHAVNSPEDAEEFLEPLRHATE